MAILSPAQIKTAVEDFAAGTRGVLSRAPMNFAIPALLAYIAENIGGAGGGGGGLTQAQAQAAIEAATNLNDVESTLATIATRSQETRDAVNNLAAQQKTVGSQLFVDAANVIYGQVLTYNPTTSTYGTTTLTLAGVPYTPVPPIVPVDKSDFDTAQTVWEITANGTGYAIGDTVVQYTLISQGPPVAVVGSLWVNNGTAIGAPLVGHRRYAGSVAATEATLSTKASEATLATRASEATLATLATEATLVTKASESTLATRASEATLATRASEATLASRLSEGVPVTGETIPSGSGALGWLSSIRAAVLSVATAVGVVSNRQRVSAFSASAVSTNATGTVWVNLGAGACTSVTLYNTSAVSVDYRVASDTTTFTLATGEVVFLPCIADSNEWQIRRTDTSNTPASVKILRVTQ
jgi:hypothetical protein